PVKSLAEALADEQTLVNAMIIEADGEVERIRVVGSPISMTDAPVTIRSAPPSLGRDTEQVRAELAGLTIQAAE
uniref:CoA transferase n=1 Tax=Stenotrophomonas maltophilia TaxID=40324 RepID=UPI0019544DB3